MRTRTRTEVATSGDKQVDAELPSGTVLVLVRVPATDMGEVDVAHSRRGIASLLRVLVQHWVPSTAPSFLRSHLVLSIEVSKAATVEGIPEMSILRTMHRTGATLATGRAASVRVSSSSTHQPSQVIRRSSALALRPSRNGRRGVVIRSAAGDDDKATEEPEKELEGWQKSWVRQNPGRPLTEMPSEEPKFNPDNFGFLSIATGGVSFLVLFGTLWLANFASELRNMSPEELEARFGSDISSDDSSTSALADAPAAPSLSD